MPAPQPRVIPEFAIDDRLVLAKVKRGGITKAGNGRARRILVEAAWSYRYPPYMKQYF